MGTLGERRGDRLGRHVEVVGVGVVERSADVLPVIGERRGDLLLGREVHHGVRRSEVQEGVEAIDGEELGDVGAILRVHHGGRLGVRAMLRGQLGRRRDLDLGQVVERALREGAEPPQGLDLDVEQVDAHGPVLGRRVDVQDAAAHRELASVVDLVHALVAGADEILGQFVEIDEVADLEREALGPQRRVGHLLRQCDGADHDDRRLGGGVARVPRDECVERGDPQPHEMRRRREVRLVRDAAGRAEPHGARVQPRPQVRRDVPGLAIVARHHDRRTPGSGRSVDAVQQRGHEVRAQGLGDERAAAVARQPHTVIGGVEVVQERAQRHRGDLPNTQTDRAGLARPGGRTIATRWAQALPGAASTFPIPRFPKPDPGYPAQGRPQGCYRAKKCSRCRPLP